VHAQQLLYINLCLFTIEPGFRCDCSAQYFGKFCQHQKYQKNSSHLPIEVPTLTPTDGMSKDLFQVLVVGASVFVAIVVIGCLILYFILVFKRYHLHQGDLSVRDGRRLFFQTMVDTCMCRSYGQNPEKKKIETLNSQTAGRLKVLHQRIALAQKQTRQEIRALSVQLSTAALKSPAAQKSLQEMQTLLQEI
jgi:hypothetical protein